MSEVEMECQNHANCGDYCETEREREMVLCEDCLDSFDQRQADLAELKALRTANQRLEGDVARLWEALELWLTGYDEVAASPNFEPFPHVAERVAKTRAALRGNGGE